MKFKDNKWRRFEFKKPDNEDKFLKLIDNKNLSRDDLILILKTIRLRDNS